MREEQKTAKKGTFRPVPGLSREDEEQQLKEILGIAQENLTRTESYVRQLNEEYHDLVETYGPKDKEALAMLHNTQAQMRERQRDLVRCRKARKTPYFGRIDFKDPGVPGEESYYVGRVGISDEASEPVVIDWRAPLASVYYENSTGTCTYTVKGEGTFSVELRRKRTYEIANDRLKEFFDSDVVANDELLTKYLARNKTAVLGEIIATIQEEQNAIIRKTPKRNLIVQGVAGSGKTTVAMHRISYILYNYEEEFRPQDFYIIGSNRILLNYITSVLPDLDVYGVSQMTMEQLFVRLLYEDWDPRFHHIRPMDKKDETVWRKGSYAWFHDLERFCQEYETSAVPRQDIRTEKYGVLLMDEAFISAYLRDNPRSSMQEKINMLNEILRAKLENELSGKYVSYTPEEKKELSRLYRWHFGRDVWKGSIFQLYREFLAAQEESGKFVSFTENEFDLYDLAALAYLYKRIKETDGIREASHVIIDEAQDFGMMAYGALEYCLRGCTYTIMGDVSQNIHYGYGLNDWEELRALILAKNPGGFGLLKKSYRNTVEISNFATEILRHGNFAVYPVEPISRHGSQVQVTACASEEEMIAETEKNIRKWLQEGRETIAVICRDEEEARSVSQRLGETLPLADSDPETANFTQGIMVLPVEYTKGLEFDGVLLYHPSAAHYPAEDRYVKLLYVAATRALHELTVVHQGDLTDLIGKPVSEEKRMQLLETERELLRESRAEKPQREFLQESQAEKTQRELLRERQAEKPQRELLQESRAEKPQREFLQEGLAEKPQRELLQEDLAEKPQKGLLQESREEKLHRGLLQESREEKPQRGLLQESPEEKLQRQTGRVKNSTAAGERQNTGVQQRFAADGAGREKPVNSSRHRFGELPDESILRPKGHSRIDCSVRIIKKGKQFIDLISRYGTLRLTPLEPEILRVQFCKGVDLDFQDGYWGRSPEGPVSWTARAGKNLVEVATENLKARIDKKTGAVQFFDQKGKLLLAERPDLPRQIETGVHSHAWAYFDWGKNEKLSAKGVLTDDMERMNQKARYISFGGRSLRMPLLISDSGYGLGIAAEQAAICCTIPTYGKYVYTDGTGRIDYYFIFGGDQKHTLELYKKISG